MLLYSWGQTGRYRLAEYRDKQKPLSKALVSELPILLNLRLDHVLGATAGPGRQKIIQSYSLALGHVGVGFPGTVSYSSVIC